MTILGDESGKNYPFTWDAKSQRLIITGLPTIPTDPKCTVIKVEFESVPQRGNESDRADWLRI